MVPEDVEISDALLESTKITPTTFDDAKRQIEKLIANGWAIVSKSAVPPI